MSRRIFSELYIYNMGWIYYCGFVGVLIFFVCLVVFGILVFFKEENVKFGIVILDVSLFFL